jgi:hypothetical protein
VCLILGGLVAWATKWLVDKVTSPLLGGFGGLVGFTMLAKVAGLKTPAAPIIEFCGCVLGVYLGRKYEKIVETVGTSLIGAAMVVRGIGCYAPGFPNIVMSDVNTDMKVDNYMIAYFAGFVVLFIFGTVWQLKHARKVEDDDFNRMKENGEPTDAFANEDEGKKCGCL